MIIAKREWNTWIDEEELTISPDLTVLKYGMTTLGAYPQRVELINTYYLRACEEGLPSELMAYLTVMVERLNQLLHFFDKRPAESEEEAFVFDYLKKFETFKPQPLDKATLRSGMTTHPVQVMTKEEMEQVTKDLQSPLSPDDLFLEDPTEPLSKSYERGYFIAPNPEEAGSFMLVNTSSTREFLSLIPNSSNEAILTELKALFIELGTLSRESRLLTNRYWFEFGQAGFHPDLVFLINQQLSTLIYWLNSASLKDRTLHAFDALELDRRLDGFLEAIEHTQHVIAHQLK